MFNINYLKLIPVTLLLISCSGGDDDNSSTLVASVSSSNDNPSYNETYTITWESNASQCYANSNTGSWLGELDPSGSQDFVAKRGGISNYGVQCRKSINFVNASTDVDVTKEFIDYFDYGNGETRNLGSLTFDASSSLKVLDTSIGDFNDDFRLDIVLLIEDLKTNTPGDSEYFVLAFYGQDPMTISSEDPYVIQEINNGNCVADKLIRADYNQDGSLDIMTVSSSAEESLNRRGLCFFLSTGEGLVLQDEAYLINETVLDLSNVEVGSHVSYDVSSNLRPDIMLLGNGGSTDLPFYVSPTEEGPVILLANPLNTLNPYTRNQGCLESIAFLCDWISDDYQFRFSVIINADGDGILDILNSVVTLDGPKYDLYNSRFENVYFDWSLPIEEYIDSSISSGDGYAIRLAPADGNIDGRTDLFALEKSISSETYKFSIYEKFVSDEDDTVNEITRTNNGDFPEEYVFDGNLNFSNEFLVFDLDSSGFLDVFIPYTELPFKEGNIGSDKHFLAFEKSIVVNEDDTVTQDWIPQDISNIIGLDSSSVNNSWIDFDNDNDIDVILMVPEISSDGSTVQYNFKLFLNESLF